MKIKKQVDLKDLIFEKVSQEQIFRFYYPYKFTLNQRCLSCFQKENNPSMIIGTKSQSGDVVFKCFNSSHKGDCINFVMQMFNLDYLDSLEKIAEDFGLKESSNIKYEQIIKELPKTTIIKQKKAPDIVVSTRSFNSDELNYWNDYYQDISDLKRENIYVPKKIWINKNPIYLKVSELTFCYYYPENDKWKIYKPRASKEKKWFTNQSFQHIENLDKIQGCKIGIATKSRKDSLILKKALGIDCVVVTQAEDFNCWTPETVEKFKKGCKIPYCSADNDLKGNAYSWSMTNNYQFKHVNVPYNIPDLRKPGSFCSDWADLARDYGIEHVYNHFVKKSII